MATIKEILAENNFRFNKQFGQNFITDTNLLKAMVVDSGISEQDIVVEIGAGAGTLTRELALVAKKVISFEIDNNLIPVLAQTLKGLEDKVQMIFKDIQKVSDEELFELVGSSFKVVANLPYYITTPIIMRFLESAYQPQSITVMVQKEVGERLVSKANSEEYGVITLAIAIEGSAKITRIVPRQMFVPEPNVDSCIVRIDTDKNKFVGVDKKGVKTLVRASFSMRRKTLVNNLISSYNVDRTRAEAALNTLGLDIRIRGEVLDISQFIALFNVLNKGK